MTDPHPRTADSGELAPMIIAVAPNGARRTKADHPAIPLGPEELAETAAACRDAGAAMIHLHVRDRAGGHLLDATAYAAASAAIRQAAGDALVIQITTEAVGRYTPDQQMAVVCAARPEAVSLAVRELLPDEAAEVEARGFLARLHADGCLVQYIVYTPAEAARLLDLRARGVVPQAHPAVLFVLGRYRPGQQSDPADLLPFLTVWQDADGARPGPWMVCAFGRHEAACALTAAGLGGHVRVGFENNLHVADGRVAPNNAALVEQVATHVGILGRRLASAADLRHLWSRVA